MHRIALTIVETLKVVAPQVNKPYRIYALRGHVGLTESYKVDVDTAHGLTINFDYKGNCTDKTAKVQKLCETNEEYRAAWDFFHVWLSYLDMEREFLKAIDGSSINALSVYQKFSELWDQHHYDVSHSTKKLKDELAKGFPKFGYVYLIPEPSGSFKIGKTSNLAQRLKTHGVKLPYKDVGYIHTFPCVDMSKTEAALHDMYKWQRLDGEWFLLNDMQLSAIQQIDHCDDIETMLDALPLPTEELRARAKAERNKEPA